MTADCDPEAALREHLQAEAFGSEFTLEQLGLDVDGWSFYRVHPQVLDGESSSAVVRDDGTVVTDDHASELAAIYRELGVLDAEDPPAETMVRAARALIAEDITPVRAPDVIRRMGMKYPDAECELPAVDRQDGGLLLTFYGEDTGQTSTLYRYEITVAADYSLGYGRTAVASTD